MIFEIICSNCIEINLFLGIIKLNCLNLVQKYVWTYIPQNLLIIKKYNNSAFKKKLNLVHEIKKKKKAKANVIRTPHGEEC